MNQVILIGNLTRDPELYTTTNNISVCKFTLAVNREYTNSDGSRDCDFIPIVTWRNIAENCATYLNKGSKVCVCGSIQTRSYEAKDGTRRYITEINANKVEFLNTKSNDNEEKPQQAEPTLSTKNNFDEQLTLLDEDLPF